jgi:hypothetical protein
MNIDRTARLVVERLHATRFLTGSSRIGVLYATDESDVPQALGLLKRRAQQLGLHVVSTFGMPELDTGQSASRGQVAAFQFAQAGVDRVISLESGGGLALYFMIAASSQHYYPKYGWHSQNSIGALAASGAAPADQLVGSRGVGWQPIYDVSYAENPASRGTPGRRRCLDLMRKAGLTASSYSVEYLMTAKCSSVWLLASALATPVATRMGPNVQAVVAGVEDLGSRFESALTLGSDFGPGRHDGVARARDFAYVTECSCLRYTGGTYDVR